VKNFSGVKRTINPPSFTTHLTTKSPQKYHDLPPQFAKTPAKTPLHHIKKKTSIVGPDPAIPSIGREG
jgi:hypothetical protein